MTLANKFTLSRIVFAPAIVAIAAFAFPNWNYYAAVVFMLASLTDTVDGHIARRYNQVTDFGKLIDPIADKLLTSAAMIVLIGWHKFPAWIGIVLVTRDIIVSAMRITAADHQLVVAARKSGKIKTLLQLLAYGAYLFNLDIVGHVFLAAGVLTTVWSLVDYLYANEHVCRGKLLTPFVISFIDKLFTAYLLFILIGLGRMPGLVAMLIIGKDNIISGIRAMSSANGRHIPTRPSECLCFLATTVLLFTLWFGGTCWAGMGLVWFMLSAVIAVWSMVDVGLRSRKQQLRVK